MSLHQCDHCGEHQTEPDMAIIFVADKPRFYCHPEWAAGITCYMQVQLKLAGEWR